MGMLETQLKAINAMSGADAYMDELILLLVKRFGNEPGEAFLLRFLLEDLKRTAILYGEVKSKHESLLKDDQTNTQKEG